MTTNNEKPIQVLNTLIEINNDRIKAYESASQETTEQDLITLFGRMRYTSEFCKRELSKEVSQLGGVPTENALAGKFRKIWLDIKKALSINDRRAMLSSFEYGEDSAVEIYEKALQENSRYLTRSLIKKIKSELELIKEDYDEIISRRHELFSV